MMTTGEWRRAGELSEKAQSAIETVCAAANALAAKVAQAEDRAAAALLRHADTPEALAAIEQRVADRAASFGPDLGALHVPAERDNDWTMCAPPSRHLLAMRYVLAELEAEARN